MRRTKVVSPAPAGFVPVGIDAIMSNHEQRQGCPHCKAMLSSRTIRHHLKRERELEADASNPTHPYLNLTRDSTLLNPHPESKSRVATLAQLPARVDLQVGCNVNILSQLSAICSTGRSMDLSSFQRTPLFVTLSPQCSK